MRDFHPEAQTAQRASNAGCKPRNAKVPLIQKPHEKGQWRWLIDVRVLWSQPVGGRVVGYSWLDGTGASHTHRHPQSSTVLKCVCVCIHITRTLINPFFVLSSHIFQLILYFLFILSVVIPLRSCFQYSVLSFFTIFLSACPPKCFGHNG